MKKIYEAIGKDKEDYIDLGFSYKAFERERMEQKIGIDELMLITKTNEMPKDQIFEGKWCINGIVEDDEKDIVIFEPFIAHLEDDIKKICETDTEFSRPIKLSKQSIYLMKTKKYDELCKNPEVKKQLKKLNIRLYEGNERLAIKMLMTDKYFLYTEMNKDGYIVDEKNRIDEVKYIYFLEEGIQQLNQYLQQNGKLDESCVNELYKYFRRQEKNEKEKNKTKKIKEEDKDKENNDYKMISGLTDEVEGDIELDSKMYASTDIGKIRKNQEDAVLLIHNKKIPDFRMMVVADGMGGWSCGEAASDAAIKELKKWFENLNDEERNCYYTSLEQLKEQLDTVIQVKAQVAVESATWNSGGTTLVCALIGKNDTLIGNIGDSRAYIAKGGKLLQVSREDTEAQIHLEKGKIPEKEASRFDSEANILTQCIGMERRYLRRIHSQILKNDEYDLLMLFTDGVTDCLSDDDIVAVCKTTDKKILANKIVEKALRHDSMLPEKYMDYIGLDAYIPGGKDNATAAVYNNERKNKNEQQQEDNER